MRASRLLSRWGLLIVFCVVFGGFSAWIPKRFPTSGNVQDILTSQPPGIFIAFAAMLVLVVGEFDLSIGATLGLSQYMVLKLITHYGLSWPMAILATLGISAGIGAANALAVVGLGINSFIATIGIATILEGVLQWISNGNTPLFGGAPHGFTTLAQTKAGVVLPIYYALAAALLLWVVLEFTVIGRQMRATGANRAAARLSGIRTGRARFTAFIVAALLASIAGMLVTAQVGAADASSGPGFLLPAYAAAFLGATAIRPGFFNVWGTVIAIFLVAVGITGLQLKGVESWVTPVFNGSVLLLAVAVSNFDATQQVLARARGAFGIRRAPPAPPPA
ncbi:MAG TPA: ABC transporter permease [Gaiellaceae bacterium]|jgi:ribose transport system permease protein|nr:ABC transporter permease [Gaiellaceae bacterium]